MVRTKRVYDPIEASDGDRILVTRYWPRPLSKEEVAYSDWLRNLAPSGELLQNWKKQKISWEGYTVRYHKEMRRQRKEIRNLATRASHGTITLLCIEREDNPRCHRHLLKRLIEKEQQEGEAKI